MSMKIAWSGQHTRGKALNVLLRALACLVRGGGGNSMNAVWSGVHEPRKALPILLKSIAVFGDFHLDVLGVGPCTRRWKHLAEILNVNKCITWHGWKKKDEAVEIVSKADVFVITSLHDLTSTVLLEALSKGKPVICLDHCGFLDVVDETCGIKIPIGKPKEVIASFAQALVKMQDEGFRKKLSEGSLRKADQYRWSLKRQALRKLYKPEWKKIVVGCYACSPSRGSEPGMGWNYLKAVAEGREVWAFVEQEKWEKELTQYQKDHPNELKGVHFIFVRKPRARLLRKIWPPSYYWFYRVWQKRVFKKALKLNAQVHFDAAHQLNMVGFREPGYLWKLPIPFVWGPVGGLGYVDHRLFGLSTPLGALEFLMRNVINWLQCHLMIRPRKAAHKAAATGTLIAATGENQREMKKLWGADSTVLCEIGVDG